MLKFSTILLSLTLLLTPTVTFAAPRNFSELVMVFVNLINIAIPILIALAVLGFFWGVTQYILSASDSTKVEEARKLMIWGIIALFVMVSVWGILRVLSNTFLDSGVDRSPPFERLIEV